MAHFTVAIIVQDDGSNVEELSARAIASINRFDTELEVPLHKRYIEPDELENMKGHYKTDHIEDIVPHLTEWNGESGGIDEKGLYVDSTRNPEGHFDDGDILGRVRPEDVGMAFLGEGNNRLCHAIVTLDGKWVNGPWVMFEPKDSEQKKELDDWLAKLASILEENKREAIFIADCHA